MAKYSKKKLDLSIIVPVFNEENNIPEFLKRTLNTIHATNCSYEIIFTIDPCSDKTEDLIRKYALKDKNIKGLIFSRRFGQPAATMAGLRYCKGNAAVIIDVDLQDPPEIIRSLYYKYLEGYDVVYAQRKTREGEVFLKKIIAVIGYYLINKFSDIKIPRNTGDFRIISRRVIDELNLLNETHGFLRGLVSFVGFKQTSIKYDRSSRYAGNSKYNKITGSIKIGLNGLIGFSAKPLFLMSLTGFTLAFFSFLFGLWYLIQKTLGVPITPGLSTTVILLTFYSGIQLLGLGLIGEYVGRIYDEVKKRPQFIIDKKINFDT